MIRGKPNVDAFLDGGIEKPAPAKVAPLIEVPRRVKAAPAVVAASAGPVTEVAAVKRTKKLFELPESLVNDLEQRCVDERRQHGRRVTQTEIVTTALRTYLYGKP